MWTLGCEVKQMELINRILACVICRRQGGVIGQVTLGDKA